MDGPNPPLLGEPLALEFANTRFAARGRERDGIETPEDLAAWLRRVDDRLPHGLTEGDLRGIRARQCTAARELRDAIRTLLSAAARGAALDSRAAEVLNQAVRGAPEWYELAVQPGPSLSAQTRGDALSAALSSIAADAIRLLGGPGSSALRACSAPDCVLFFLKDHPRRACCSARCSNRVRSARHYARRSSANRPATP